MMGGEDVLRAQRMTHGVVVVLQQRPGGTMRRSAAYAAGGTLLVAMLLIAATENGSRSRTALANAVSDALNEKFLQASAQADFLTRLNDLWFVEANAGRPELAADATRLASSMQIAGFPSDMKDNIDVTVNPCSDFYEFACGKYDDENRDKIEAFKSSRSYAWDTAEKNIRENLIEILKKDDGPAGKLYNSCMDVDAIEKLGNAPLLPWLKYIDAINDKDALVTACTEFSKHDMDNFFGWWISQDPHDSSRKVFYLSQTSFSLPDKTYYLEDSDEMRKHREVFVAVASKLYSKVGYSQEEADKRAAAILEFETNIAKIQVDKEISRKDHGTQIEWSKMEELMPFWPWKSWLQQLSTCTPPPDGAAQVCTSDHPDVAAVGQPDKTQLYLMSADFFPKMNTLLEETSFDTVKVCA
jgi:predicted metalloendopeptidase